MGRAIKRIIKGLLVALTTTSLIAVPVCGEEILLDEGISGGLIKAEASAILDEDELLVSDEERVMLYPSGEKIIDTEEISMSDDVLFNYESSTNLSLETIDSSKMGADGAISGLREYDNGATTVNEVLKRINEIRSVLPGDKNNHAYFTTDNKPCTLHTAGEGHCYKCTFQNVMRDRLGLNPLRAAEAYTCKGFAMFVFEYVFRVPYTEGNSRYNYSVIKNISPNSISDYAVPGDVLAYKNNSGCFHMAIYVGKSDSGITVYEANKASWGVSSVHYGDAYLGDADRVDIWRNADFQHALENGGGDNPVPDPNPGEDMGTKSPYKPEIEDGKYILLSALRDDLHLNVDGDESADNDCNVNVERGLGGDEIYYDVFKVSILDNGYYKLIQNGTNHMAVSVAGKSTSEKANIQMYRWWPEDLDNNTEFQWAIQWAGKDKESGIPYHYVRARCSGSCMTADGDKNGKNVYQSEKTKEDDQKWFFTRYMKPDIETDSLPSGTVGKDYSAKLEADSDLDVKWTFTSKNDSLPPGLSLDKKGKITGTPTKAGTYTFSLDAENALVDALGLSTRKYTITISDATIPVTSVTLDKTSISIKEGESSALRATVVPSNATNKTLSWKSDNTKVATVDNTGKVTAVSEGKATITATSTDGSNISASCTVTVVKQIVAAESISVSPASKNITVGDTLIITVSVLPESTTDKSVTWTSSNTKVATVTDAGVVTGISEGSAEITATTSNGKTAKCGVTVIGKDEAVKVSFDVCTTEITTPQSITVTVNKPYGDLPAPSRKGQKLVGWYTEKTGGNPVDKTTIVTNTKDHTLYARWQEWDEESQTNEEMNSGKDGTTITAKKVDLSKEFGTDANVRYVIKDASQKKLASITSNGVLTAKKTGKVIVTVQKKENDTLTEQDVTYDIVVPKGSSLPYGKLYHTGQTFDLNTLLKDNGVLHPNTWTTTAKSTVATVDSKTGILTVGEKDGSAMVYAVYGTDKNARKVKVSVKISHKKIDISNDFTPVTGKTRFKIVDKGSKKIASVSAKGLLTVKKDGTVIVTLQVKNGKKWDDVETKTYQVTNPL